MTYARWTGTDLSPRLPTGLLTYALVHVALFGFLVWGNGGTGRGTLGIGAILMFVALCGLWRALKTANTSRFPTSTDAQS
ncbi:MAG: hypothetical protein EOO38_30565 [Cytophagaceae bacterium]|nr:MAG: hypothetical protein EOO38_30565 [Cytophagaceae bacterium]